jgi:hypothetical protein
MSSVSSNDPLIYLDSTGASELLRIIKKVDGMTGDGVTNTPTQITIGNRSGGNSNQNGDWDLVYVTAYTYDGSGNIQNGRYAGTRIQKNITSNATGPIQYGDIGVLPGTVSSPKQDCWLWNVSEVQGGIPFWPSSGVGALAMAVQIGVWTSSSTTLPLLVTATAPQGLIRVPVSQTGGSNGTNSSAPSYTYSVTFGTQTISGLTLSGRANGSFVPASQGIGYWAPESIGYPPAFTLVWANEYPGTNECTGDGDDGG